MYNNNLQNLMNNQIQLEFQASHIYRGFSIYLSHPKVAYNGFAKYFSNEADDELKHAQELSEYHQKRGGTMELPNISSFDTKLYPLQALQQALLLENQVLDNFILISQNSDDQTRTFIDKYLQIQTDSIAEYTELITKASRLDNNIGLYMLDNELLNNG
jgi:ferritin